MRRFAVLALAAVVLACASATAPANSGLVGEQTLAGQLDGSAVVAMSPAGYAVSAWTERAAGTVVVRVALRAPGGGWSAPQSLPASQTLNVELGVAADDAGDAAVTWWEEVGGRDVVAVSTRAAGGSFGQPELFGPPAFGPAVGIDAHGRVTLLSVTSSSLIVRDFQAGSPAATAVPQTLSAASCSI
ncbi:MAG TPA: hypothetical protein VFV85_03790, partial [Conexibacter sp.]|nr:hypothetical protein [Conexibacter sp.]